MTDEVPAEALKNSTSEENPKLESSPNNNTNESPSNKTEPSLLEKISQAMDEAKWAHTVNHEKKFILLIATNDIASLRLHFIVKESDNTIILMISPERICPPGQIKTMAKFLNIINDFLPFGFFTLDFVEGEIRFRQSLDVEGILITSEFIDKFLGTSVQMVRQFYLSLHDIMNGRSIEFVMDKLKNKYQDLDNDSSSSLSWTNVVH